MHYDTKKAENEFVSSVLIADIRKKRLHRN